MATSHFYKDVVPFSAIVAAEFSIVVLSILFKLASAEGLSYYIFVTYTYALSTLILLPLAYMNFHRATGLPSFNWSLLKKLFLLGLLGFLMQLCGFTGIEHSSPTLASALSSLTPTFTFILAVIFRMEKVALRSSTTIAKIMGTMVSISGALVVVLYKGPAILSVPSLSPSPSLSLNNPLRSSQTNWILGGLLLTTSNLLNSVVFIIQTHIIKSYPAELIVVFLYNLFATLVSVPVSLLAETKLSAWKLRLDILLVAILCSGFFTTFSFVVHTWGIHLKGPVYVTSFKPLSIAIAAAMSVIFLGDDLYLGSVVGAVILTTGFYAVIWGKAKEEEVDDLHEDCGFGSLGPSSDAKTPLLPSFKT
ncbi:WAT1-related protein [Quillaja saponaria]|uniref:WAT1-related protein n=1 Tax=Quillaja saponaria TaxID=32244 RepID=A0AAD7Q454_QUISA|nr:WAT1-related protein [Quillaja saponaria]